MQAVIPFARAARAVPVAGHPTMTAVLVVAELRAVTLRTKLHRVSERDRCPVGQMQSCIAILRVMACDARQATVIQFQALMKLI